MKNAFLGFPKPNEMSSNCLKVLHLCKTETAANPHKHNPRRWIQQMLGILS